MLEAIELVRVDSTTPACINHPTLIATYPTPLSPTKASQSKDSWTGTSTSVMVVSLGIHSLDSVEIEALKQSKCQSKVLAAMQR